MQTDYSSNLPGAFKRLTLLHALVSLVALAGASSAAGEELVVFDWNGPATQKDRGFPWNQPPVAAANGNWTIPVNYAEGTFHLRVEIRSQPVPQEMNLQFCVWQNGPKGKHKELETCSSMGQIYGVPGARLTWSQAINGMWRKKHAPIDWTRPRFTYGVAIKNRSRRPVSSFAGWKWNGENPAEWYPLDMRFTAVVVSKGATFSGWDNYTQPN